MTRKNERDKEDKQFKILESIMLHGTMRHDGRNYEVTPLGYFCLMLNKLGLEKEQAEEVWHSLEGFCIKLMVNRCRDEGLTEGDYVALVFDGAGGDILGVDKQKGPVTNEEDDDEDY